MLDNRRESCYNFKMHHHRKVCLLGSGMTIPSRNLQAYYHIFAKKSSVIFYTQNYRDMTVLAFIFNLLLLRRQINIRI